MTPIKLALDYDKTYSLNPAFWDEFIGLALVNGYDIRGVTARSSIHDRTAALVEWESKLPVIYTNGIAKEFHCRHFTGGWFPDVWIDDKVINILGNSLTSPEDLAEWRRTRNEGPSYPLPTPTEPMERYYA